jgi:hypothetical protein
LCAGPADCATRGQGGRATPPLHAGIQAFRLKPQSAPVEIAL